MAGKKHLIRKDDEPQKISAPPYIKTKPVFSFEYLEHQHLNTPKHNPELYKDFLIRLKYLSSLGWREIHTSSTHSYGYEHIPLRQFIPQIPSCVTPDISKLMVFRADGANHVFAGFIRDDIFFVVFIESDFNQLYHH